MRRGPGPPGRRQQQLWARPSLQTAIRAMVTRTESSEPVRQQLVRVSLEATHCHPGCTLCLDLGSEGPHAPLGSGLSCPPSLCYISLALSLGTPVLDTGTQPLPPLEFPLHSG